MGDKTFCEDCQCWIIKDNSGAGDCKRHAPVTFEQVYACWPRTQFNDFCFEGIPKEQEILHD